MLQSSKFVKAIRKMCLTKQGNSSFGISNILRVDCSNIVAFQTLFKTT